MPRTWRGLPCAERARNEDRPKPRMIVKMTKKLAAGFALLIPALAAADVHYTLQPDPAGNCVHVTMKIDQAGGNPELHIPAWCPGYYTLLDYQKDVEDVRAFGSDGQALAVSHEKDSRDWKVSNPSEDAVTVRYRVKSGDPQEGFFRDYVSEDQAYANGAATYLYADEHLTDKDTLKIEPPKGWNVSVPLDADDKGLYETTNYDELVDSPVQMGRFLSDKFLVSGKLFSIVVVSPAEKPDVDLEQVKKTLALVCEPTMRMFGGEPFKHYTFYLHLTSSGFQGGLEHRACTVLALPNTDVPDFGFIAAHEFFHAWNVKQIRPKVLGPFDYSKPAVTGNLWFVEGVTDYYAARACYESGYRDRDWFASFLDQDIAELQGGQTRRTETLEQCSKDVWDNGGLTVGDMSFYTKGALAGLLFDAEIRADTNGSRSLDDVMRDMYTEYRLPHPGYPEDGILTAINRADGKDMTELYDTVVRSTKELPYEVLQRIGLRAVAPGDPYVVPGYRTDADGRVVWESRTNADDGLMLGDQIVARRNSRVDYNYKTPGVGDPEYAVQVLRQGQPVTINLRYVFDRSDAYRLIDDDFATPDAVRLREQYLQRPKTVEEQGGDGSGNGK